jgi:hypothetical protein
MRALEVVVVVIFAARLSLSINYIKYESIDAVGYRGAM